MTTKEKALTIADFTNSIDVPANAPKPPAWMFDENASIDDALPSKFFSMESLNEWLRDRNAQSRVLTTRAITCELMYDPSKGEGEASGEWKPVLWFNEVETGLVINKTRGQHLKQLSGSTLLKAWGSIGQIALEVGVFNGKAQIGIAPIPSSSGVRAANADLFGDEEIPF